MVELMILPKITIIVMLGFSVVGLIETACLGRKFHHVSMSPKTRGIAIALGDLYHNTYEKRVLACLVGIVAIMCLEGFLR